MIIITKILQIKNKIKREKNLNLQVTIFFFFTLQKKTIITKSKESKEVLLVRVSAPDATIHPLNVQAFVRNDKDQELLFGPVVLKLN